MDWKITKLVSEREEQSKNDVTWVVGYFKKVVFFVKKSSTIYWMPQAVPSTKEITEKFEAPSIRGDFPLLVLVVWRHVWTAPKKSSGFHKKHITDTSWNNQIWANSKNIVKQLSARLTELDDCKLHLREVYVLQNGSPDKRKRECYGKHWAIV